MSVSSFTRAISNLPVVEPPNGRAVCANSGTKKDTKSCRIKTDPISNPDNISSRQLNACPPSKEGFQKKPEPEFLRGTVSPVRCADWQQATRTHSTPLEQSASQWGTLSTSPKEDRTPMKTFGPFAQIAMKGFKMRRFLNRIESSYWHRSEGPHLMTKKPSSFGCFRNSSQDKASRNQRTMALRLEKTHPATCAGWVCNLFDGTSLIRRALPGLLWPGRLWRILFCRQNFRRRSSYAPFSCRPCLRRPLCLL